MGGKDGVMMADRPSVVSEKSLAMLDDTPYAEPVPKDRQRLKRLAGVAAALVVLGAVGAVVAVVLTRGDGADGSEGGGPEVQGVELPPAGGTIRVKLEDDHVLGLARSEAGHVTVVMDAATMAPQARSYDGRGWEVIQGISADCDATLCRVDVSDKLRASAGGELLLATYASDPTVSEEELNARFLMQGTFGPTRETIAALGTSDANRFRSWVEAQAKEPPSLLRELFRKRANPQMRVQSVPGRPREACAAGSRWHEHALTLDDVGRNLTVEDRDTYLEIRVDDTPRHHWVDKATWDVDPALAPLVICSVQPSVGGKVTLGAGCAGEIGNPSIVFTAAPPAERTLEVAAADMEELTPPVAGHKLLRTAAVAGQESCGMPTVGPVFAKTSSGDVMLHDPRLELVENTVDKPALGAAGESSCPSAPRTFLNEDSCVVSAGGCSSARYSDVPVTLDEASLRTFFTAGGKYVYRVTGLKNDNVASPCRTSSRWSVEQGVCAAPSNNIGAGTLATLRALLVASFSEDGNALVRDIPRPDKSETCEEAQAVRAVIQVEHQGEQYCLSQVHPDLNNVYDMSFWTLLNAHPGNKDALNGGRANPIKRHAEDLVAPSTDMPFPGWHPTNRWNQNVRYLELLGRFGDTVSFRDLPSSVQTRELGEAFGAVAEAPADVTQALGLSCGSPGEVAHDPRLGSRFGFGVASPNDADPGQGRLDETVGRQDVQLAAWTLAALQAPDQLRQRVAWALSQILVASASDTSGRDPSEMYLTFYDIFVRHAFGRFRDVLREVSYSPVMGRMLSFVYSKSLQSSGSFPDENYAREIMQLFTMGLVELRDDGTEVLDADGVPVPTYSNEDILEFARLWTGFERQPRRSNVETMFGPASSNEIDPMKLNGRWRDSFPKLGLRGRYVGDGYPVCEELPERAFLRKGAVYRFLGASPEPELQADRTGDLVGELALRVELDPAKSALAAKLCGGSDATDLATCDWKAQVELDTNLDCAGLECEIDIARVVMLPQRTRRCPAETVLEQHSEDGDHGDVCRDAYGGSDFVCPTGCSPVAEGAAPYCSAASGSSTPCRIDPSEHTGVFFEYVQPACVHLSFYNDGKRIGNTIQREALCANPRSIIASEACCAADSDSGRATNRCLYGDERLTFASAQRRCAERFDAARTTCDFEWLSSSERCPITPRRSWVDAPCHVQAKVGPDGKVAIVHDVGQSVRDEPTAEYMRDLLSRESENWFRVVWADQDAFPHAKANGCASGACETLPAVPGEEPTCLCNTVTREEAVFSTLPTVKQAIEQLHVGSAPADSFEAGTYVELPAAASGVRAFRRGDGQAFDADALFAVTVPGLGTRWLRNVRSVVAINGTVGMEFRNPPNFHDADTIETRDAMHETEAALDHYLEHPTTAPFLSRSLIQHLVTSNPSPRYVQAVTTAFRSGTHDGLGSGQYGDLLATTAAVLLDPEARNAVLDADPAAGKHRQSMLKLTHVMRALEFTSHTTLTVLRNLNVQLGMEPLDAPSVFSFYLPGYAPVGPIKKASLVAPEAQLLTTPLVVSTLNGLFSLAKHGLTHCDGGFGLSRDDTGSCRGISYGDVDPANARGRLTFEPSAGLEVSTGAQVVAELDLLLTGGRLDRATAAQIAAEYDTERAASTAAKALSVAVQLVIATPHFQNSNQCLPLDQPRAEGPAGGSADTRPYKAVVYVNLQGGMDSFNALVPKSGCGGKDLYAEYATVRGEPVALGLNDLRDIDTSGQGQPCSTFGINPSLDTVQALYEAGEAIFLANTGALVEPIAGKQSNAERPRGLFAHNIQQRAIQTAVPQSASGAGVLGRLQDVLAGAGYSAASYSISGNADALNSDRGIAPPADILDRRNGVPVLDSNPSTPRMRAAIEQINLAASGSLFGETWAGTLSRTLNRTEELNKILDTSELEQDFEDESRLGDQLEQVARLIQARDSLGSNRNAFYVTLGGFDTHNNGRTQLNDLLGQADNALDSFVQELKLQGVWDDVVVVFASEFGRTLTNNGVGTDHAWGGNYWMVGGGLKGGRVLGEYPSDLTNASPLNLGRGRLIPTTSWDSVWNGIAQWLGVTSAAGLDEVLPNRANFADQLWTGADLFKSG